MSYFHLVITTNQYGMSARCMVMSSNVGPWHSVKESCHVVCLNKAVGIMGVKCVALSAVLLWLVLGDINSDPLG